MTTDARRAVATLWSDAAAADTARRLVQDLCAQSRLPEHLVADAAVVAAELVRAGEPAAGRTLRVHVHVGPDRLTLRIQQPVAPHPSDEAVRAWETVRRLASSFGYRHDRRGHERWALLRVPTLATDIAA